MFNDGEFPFPMTAPRAPATRHSDGSSGNCSTLSLASFIDEFDRFPSRGKRHVII